MSFAATDRVLSAFDVVGITPAHLNMVVGDRAKPGDNPLARHLADQLDRLTLAHDFTELATVVSARFDMIDLERLQERSDGDLAVRRFRQGLHPVRMRDVGLSADEVGIEQFALAAAAAGYSAPTLTEVMLYVVECLKPRRIEQQLWFILENRTIGFMSRTRCNCASRTLCSHREAGWYTGMSLRYEALRLTLDSQFLLLP
jgi:hypothetical protein